MRNEGLTQNRAPGESPLVSIGLPVYNEERFLAQTLDSLLAQSHRNLELIICDNCSTDGTEEVCRRYAASDPRIRCHRNASNIGASRNFNLAFVLSRGEYFKWSAANDLCGGEYIERCIEVLDRRPDVVLCYPKTQLIDENNVSIEAYADRLNLQFDAPQRRLAHLLRNLGMCNAIYGVLRSRVLRTMRLLGLYVNSDQAFLAQLALHGRFVEIPETLFFRRAFELSAEKYPSPYDRMVVYEKHKAGNVSFPYCCLLADHLSAIHHAPIGATERLLCYAHMHIWMRRHGRDLLQDVKAAAKHFSRRPGVGRSAS
jgi:glycosyltransferase involved in cell wall biosynthesis